MSMDLTVSVSTGKGNGDGAGRREYFVDPKAGMYQAILVDWIDHGFSKNSFNKVTRKVQPAFQLATVIDEKMIVAAKKKAGLPVELDEADRELIGRRLYVRGKKMSFSLFPGGKNMKASDLYDFLSNWNGEPLPKGSKGAPHQENLESYIGKNAQLMISRTASKNDPSIVYSNIVSIMPFDEEDGEPLALDETYVRVKDRDNYTAPPTLEDVEGADLGLAPTSTAAPAATRSASELAADEAVAIPFGE
jgi:hypothetical protein